MAKYLIRAPFALHLVKIVPYTENGVQRRRFVEESFFHGPDPVELTDTQALAHMHKLEPADVVSKKLFDKYHDDQAAAIKARSAAAGNEISLAQQISAAVIGTLVELGIVHAPAKLRAAKE